MNDIKNSSGNIIGFTDIQEDCIIIHNNTRPELLIQDQQDILQIKNKNREEEFLIHLYDDYYLTCGEIASLYGVCYSNINKILKLLPTKTSANAGRRNRSYGKKQSQETKEKISQGIRLAYKNGAYVNVQPYERTPEIREKISNGLKKYFQEHPQSPEPHRSNWRNGVYSKVDFHHGIGGSFYSFKNQQRIYFRSLLELSFMLLLEQRSDISEYQYEPISITCDNGSVYTPDLKINNTIIELKSYKYVHSQADILNKFLYKKEQCESYCLDKGLNYKVIYDIDFDFDSSHMKRHLQNHPEIIEKYQIIFNDPSRMVIK